MSVSDPCLQPLQHKKEDRLEAWYKKYHRQVALWAYSRIGNREDAGEIAHDVFMAVIRHWSVYRETAEPKFLLAKITRAKCIDWIRKNQNNRDRSGLSPDQLQDPSQRQIYKKLDRELFLRQCAPFLSHRQHNAFRLFILEEKSVHEIAAEMKTTAASVRSLLYQTTKKIENNKKLMSFLNEIFV
ncbi:MAG: sigma-70 family RNA polymerase sigma factor [Candidatus Omnitrophica bacterium]|nr:sigma-70 family RNA polymerase sigma factor [Candidatus Omnitrophota bacterium]